MLSIAWKFSTALAVIPDAHWLCAFRNHVTRMLKSSRLFRPTCTLRLVSALNQGANSLASFETGGVPRNNLVDIRREQRSRRSGRQHGSRERQSGHERVALAPAQVLAPQPAYLPRNGLVAKRAVRAGLGRMAARDGAHENLLCPRKWRCDHPRCVFRGEVSESAPENRSARRPAPGCRR